MMDSLISTVLKLQAHTCARIAFNVLKEVEQRFPKDDTISLALDYCAVLLNEGAPVNLDEDEGRLYVAHFWSALMDLVPALTKQIGFGFAEDKPSEQTIRFVKVLQSETGVVPKEMLDDLGIKEEPIIMKYYGPLFAEHLGRSMAILTRGIYEQCGSSGTAEVPITIIADELMSGIHQYNIPDEENIVCIIWENYTNMTKDIPKQFRVDEVTENLVQFFQIVHKNFDGVPDGILDMLNIEH